MEYIFLFIVVLLLSFQNFISKQYSIRAKVFNIWLFSGMTTLGALMFFIINAGFQVEFIPEVFPYSLLFAVCFGAAVVGCTMAMKSGMFSLTTLANSYSLIIPTLFGIVILDDDILATGYIGIICLFVSIYLLNKKRENCRFSVCWLIWITVTFFGDGLCSTVQKIQQLNFDGMHKNVLMIYAFAILTVGFLLAGLITSKTLGKEFSEAAKYGLIRGMANGAVNYMVLVLTGMLPNAILFPLISAGGITVSFIIAVFIYRERLAKMQIIGYLTGIASVLLLNL